MAMPVCPAPARFPFANAFAWALIALWVLLPGVGCQSTEISPQDVASSQAPSATANSIETGVVGDAELTPAQIVVATAADTAADPDARRDALLTIIRSAAADEPVYLDFYRALLADPTLDPTVATAAFTALANFGEPADTERVLPWLDSQEDFTRWQAVVSLQRLHNPAAVPALIRKTTDDLDADIRMAAVAALGQYPRRDVFDALVIALDDRDYGVSRTARETLGLLTDHDAGDDPRAWLDFANENPSTFLSTPQNYTFTPYPGNPQLPLFWIKPNPQPQSPIGYTPPQPAE